MNPSSAEQISFKFDSNRNRIIMLIDEQTYVLLTVKSNPIARGIIRQLESDDQVIAEAGRPILAITGLAFYPESFDEEKLVLWLDPVVVGIYVKEEDFESVKFLSSFS